MIIVSHVVADYPVSLISYWNFDESSSGTGKNRSCITKITDPAFDLISSHTATFVNTVQRTVGFNVGAAVFGNSLPTDAIYTTGSNNFTTV